MAILLSRRSPDGTNNHWFVQNDGVTTVQVTVGTTERCPNQTRALPPKTFPLAPGQEAFVGGEFANNCNYIFAIIG